MMPSVDKVAIDLLKAARAADKRGASVADDLALLRTPIEELDLDSLEKLEFVMKLEDTFNVMLDEADVEQCKTLGDFARLVERAAT